MDKLSIFCYWYYNRRQQHQPDGQRPGKALWKWTAQRGINIPYLEKALSGDQLHAGREPWQPGESMKTQNKTPSKPGATEQVM